MDVTPSALRVPGPPMHSDTACSGHWSPCERWAVFPWQLSTASRMRIRLCRAGPAAGIPAVPHNPTSCPPRALGTWRGLTAPSNAGASPGSIAVLKSDGLLRGGAGVTTADGPALAFRRTAPDACTGPSCKARSRHCSSTGHQLHTAFASSTSTRLGPRFRPGRTCLGRRREGRPPSHANRCCRPSWERDLRNSEGTQGPEPDAREPSPETGQLALV